MDDASPLCYGEGDPIWVAASVFLNLTEANVPPETNILYEDWMPHYRAERTYKQLLDRGLKNQVSIDGYLWTKAPQWSHLHIRRDGKMVVRKSIVSQVTRVLHACAHPGQTKTLELFLRRFHADMRTARLRETVNKALSDCVVCAQAKERRGPHPESCKPFPVPSFPFSSVAIDFVELAEVHNQSTKTEMSANYAMVIVCRLTGIVMAIPCCKEGLTSRKAADLFLHRSVFFMGLPREIPADNPFIISSTFFNALCNLAGIEQAKSIIYRPNCNGRAESAVQSTVNTLRQYLLSRKMSWLEALPLALWGLNDLPGAVSPYSPDQLVFNHDPIGPGDLPQVVDSEGCEDATQCFGRVAAEKELVQEKLEALHKKQLDKFLKEQPPSVFLAGDRVWVQNREEEGEKLAIIWQRPATIIDKIPDSVLTTKMEQDRSVDRLKPFVKLHDRRQPPLHYYAERCEIQDYFYVMERLVKHEWRGKGANGREKRARQPLPGAKPWWYVTFRDPARLEWHPAAIVLHDINTTWIKYNVQHELRLDLSHVNLRRVQVDDSPLEWRLRVNLLCSWPPVPEPEPEPEREPEPQPEPQRGSVIATLRHLWNGGPYQGDGEPVLAANAVESPFLSLYPDTPLM